MAGTANVREGMTVYSADGKKLGKVVERDQETLVIEKGLFFKKDYVVTPDDIDQVEDDEVTLRLTQDQLDDGARGKNNQQGVADEASEDEDGGQDRRRATSEPEASSGDSLSAGADGQPEDVVIVIEEEVVTVVPDAPVRRRRR